MCAITGLVIVTNLLKNPESVERYSFAELATAAFVPIPFGRTVLGISLILFAVIILIGWSYFGEKAGEYLFGKAGISTYRLCYIVYDICRFHHVLKTLYGSLPILLMP